jgi:hypothetical protein
MLIMQVIQTRYNNHFFRSRLEARWAVFFDHLGIKWLYELEGFGLSDGSGYLPDFYFPQCDLYAEVKPMEQDDPRWELFVKESKNRLMLLFGQPHALPCRTLSADNGKLYSSPWILVPPGFKYHPVYFACSDQDTYYADDPAYMAAVEEACSARFEIKEV